MKKYLAVCLLALFVGACNDNDDDDDNVEETFANPPEISSIDGELNASLRVETAQVEIGGQPVFTRVYNNSYTPPTLRLNPGDTLFLELTNTLAQNTNVHYHGTTVSPLANSDNIFLQIPPGGTLNYQIDFPESQERGMYWYHPHAMRIPNEGDSESQTFGGMAGALIVEGVLNPYPELRDVKERVMLLKRTQIVNGEVPENPVDGVNPTYTVNGQSNPVLTIHPGETQFWRIGNVSADAYYLLELEGHVLYQFTRDGNQLNRIVEKDQILVPPSARVEVFVQGALPGTYHFRHLGYNTGPIGDDYPAAVLATLVVQGRAQDPIEFPELIPVHEDLRGREIKQNRLIVFTENDTGTEFYINGQKFDMNRTDTVVQLGDLEEWTIQNATEEEHVFHIHQIDFQVTEVNGVPQDFIGYQDTVNVSIQQNGIPGEVKLLMPFDDPIIVGRFVYHCHILEHEDAGMMATIQVVDPNNLQAMGQAFQQRLRAAKNADEVNNLIKTASLYYYCGTELGQRPVDSGLATGTPLGASNPPFPIRVLTRTRLAETDAEPRPVMEELLPW